MRERTRTVIMGDDAPNPFDIADPSTTATAVTSMQQLVSAIGKLTAAVKNVSFQSTGVTSSATAGAATLPANPVGFLTITLPSGEPAKVPYYDP
jgi:hypothetical protein